MNIIIVGQGAMGLLWYHHTSKLIEDSVLYSETQLHLLPSNNSPSNNKDPQGEHYTFTDHNNQKHGRKINYAQTEQLQAADIIILCLKSFHIASALKEISAQLQDNVTIVLAHNGMGTLAELPQSIIDKYNIYALLTTHGCLRTAPLTITHTGIGVTDIGLLSGFDDLKQQKILSQLLNSALSPVKYHQEIRHKQWLKLAINCVINPLTAINNIENGKINNAEYFPIVTVLLTEIVSVAGTQGIELNLTELRQAVKNVALTTAKNSSSMRCDVLANRRSEIDYINGYIHRLGIQHNIATPENTKMWQAVKSLTK